jgi:hypothetical protein
LQNEKYLPISIKLLYNECVLEMTNVSNEDDHLPENKIEKE